MKHRLVAAGAVCALTLTGTTLAAAPADAARCLSGADVRGKVAAFVHSLRDDVASASARRETKHALVTSLRTARGAQADTGEERSELGQQIAALAKQLKDTSNVVERKALVEQIHALQIQKRADGVSGEDVKTLHADAHALAHAIKTKTDTEREDNQVAAFVHALMAQFAC